jgi:hypothetical protein
MCRLHCEILPTNVHKCIQHSRVSRSSVLFSIVTKTPHSYHMVLLDHYFIKLKIRTAFITTKLLVKSYVRVVISFTCDNHLHEWKQKNTTQSEQFQNLFRDQIDILNTYVHDRSLSRLGIGTSKMADPNRYSSWTDAGMQVVVTCEGNDDPHIWQNTRSAYSRMLYTFVDICW